VVVGQSGLAPVGTGARTEEGAASTKEVSAGEGGGEVRLGGSAANKSNGFRLGGFTSRRETRTVSCWGGRHSWGSSWTLRGGLRDARIRGVGNILVPGRTESGEDFVADGTGAIEGGVLATTVDAERGGGPAASYDRLLKASFWTALVSASVGRTVMEESADRTSLSFLFA